MVRHDVPSQLGCKSFKPNYISVKKSDVAYWHSTASILLLAFQDSRPYNNGLLRSSDVSASYIVLKDPNLLPKFDSSTLGNKYSNGGTNIQSFVFDHIIRICPVELKGYIFGCLMDFISTFCNENVTFLDQNIVKNAHKKYFPVDHFSSTKEGKEKLRQIEVVLKAAIIFFLSLQKEYVFDLIATVEELLDAYPEFRAEKLDDDELRFLLAFRNYMKVALYLIPGKLNKSLLMNICALPEGSGRSYHTGGAQIPATTRRVRIYEEESHEKPQPRAPRRSPEEMAEQPKLQSEEKLFTCECGSVVKVRNIWRHNRTQKHKHILSIMRGLDS